MFSAVLLAAGGVYCYVFNQFWTHLDTRNFSALAQFSSPHIRGYRGRQILVHREMVPLLDQLETVAETNHIVIVVTSSYRRIQAGLSKQIVTPATRSNHLAGHAIDLNIQAGWHLYESGELKRSLIENLPPGIRAFLTFVRDHPMLRWGGDFTTEDPVHVDTGLNQTDPETWDASVNACSRDHDQALPRWKTWLQEL